MQIQFSELLDFIYDHSEKDFLQLLFLVDGFGRKTVARILLYLKKHKMSYKQFWVEKLAICDNLFINKNFYSKANYHELEQKFISLSAVLKKHGIRVVAFWEKEYPKLLKQTDDFPLLLYCRGDIELLNGDTIGVVGTRKVTSYGEMVTKKIVSELVGYEYSIVSGGMYGVDAIAHQEAMQSGGKTIAVLGYGFLVTASDWATQLQSQILDAQGCVITEYMPHTKPNKGTFPERNRIVAGISKGVVVTEAAIKSGSHITAECALDVGRPVFAVPGSILNPYSQGTKYLINQGAELVCSGSEIVADFRKVVKIPDSNQSILEFEGLSELSYKVVQAIQFYPQTTDDLVKSTGIEISELLNTLSLLELESIVEHNAGQWQLMV